MTITFTATFEDPATIAAELENRTGLDVFRPLLGKKQLVPIGATLGFWLAEVSEGVAVFEAEAGQQCLNPMGGVQGGWYAAVLDAALGVCLHTVLPAGAQYSTVELKVNLVRAVTPTTGIVRATGRIIHRGRRTAVTEARMEDAAGRLYAHATATQLVVMDG